MSASDYQYDRGGKGGKALLALTMTLIVGLVFFINRDDAQEGNEASLVVYCAAGIQPPVEEAARQFEKDIGVKVHLEYANSGVLANKLKLDKEASRARADLYIPADYVFSERAREENLTTEALKVAWWKIVLGAKPGLGLEVNSIDELLEKKIRFVICEPLAGAGKKTKKVLQDPSVDKWDAIQKTEPVSFPTVTEAALAVKDGGGIQAGFMWNSTAAQNGLKVIDLPELEKSRANITVAVTSTSRQPALALQFARYLAAPEKGGEVFARHKYNPIPGDSWAVVPRLRIDCGGVNREAVEKTINEFKVREGCEVDVSYAGCGTLVSKMQPGGNSIPDLFMTCDASYLTKAQDSLGHPFGPDLKVAKTRIGMLLRKGNPKEIAGLTDLSEPGLRIGITDSRASTLGTLTEKLFDSTGQGSAIRENVAFKTDTAHLLIQNMDGGEKLDVVLVYEANVQHLKEKFVFFPLQSASAIAIQNVAAKKTTPYPQLAERLVEQLTSEDSRRRFEQLGFTWEANKSP
jgi:molybdate transport system substrate-binding protein